MLYLFTELDRTLLPNGSQDEWPAARPLFARLAACSDVFVTYVSGRSCQLIQDAIDEFGIQEPVYAVADIGTSMYLIGPDGWQLIDQGHTRIGQSWADPVNGIAPKLNDIEMSYTSGTWKTKFPLSS